MKANLLLGNCSRIALTIPVDVCIYIGTCVCYFEFILFIICQESEYLSENFIQFRSSPPDFSNDYYPFVEFLWHFMSIFTFAHIPSIRKISFFFYRNKFLPLFQHRFYIRKVIRMSLSSSGLFCYVCLFIIQIIFISFA